MKIRIFLLLFYVMTLTTLPSVRAIKLWMGHSCEKMELDKPDCEKSKFIMSLQFNPMQIINEFFFHSISFYDLHNTPTKKSYYETLFIQKYQHNIWHPPKFFISS